MSEEYEIPRSLLELEEQMRQAEERLSETIAGTQAQSFDRGPSISQEEIREVTRHASSRDAPPEMRALQKRINNGEFSWDDILAGRMMDDEGVQAALASNMPDDLSQLKDRLEAGEDVDAIIEGGPGTAVDDEAEAERKRRRKGGDF